MKKLQHIHIMVKAEILSTHALDLEGLKSWLRKSVEEQGLEPVIGPSVVQVDDVGNEGPTGSVNIKTSHMAFHLWEKTGLLQADLYTCGPLDIQKFLAAFAVFNPTKIEYLVLDRATGFTVTEAGTLSHEFIIKHLGV